MSKLYDIYLDKKKENSSKLYLFRNGSFYLLFNEDAEIVNKELSLKITSFANDVVKCGFPVKEIEKHTKFIKLLGYEYEIVLDNVGLIVHDIMNLDIDKMKEMEAIMILEKYQILLQNE